MSGVRSTIFARSTGTGRAAIAVMRISGPLSGPMLDALAGGRPAPRRASLRRLYAADLGEVLDRALVLWFPGPTSHTGEDSAELHVHAGPAIVEAVAEALVRLGGRPAEPGEFTRRAFEHGKLDLLEAEAVADLVEAETQAQRRQALLQADGALSRLYDGWADRLRRLLAHQEALIDFPDEDLPPDVEAGLVAELGRLLSEMKRHLGDGDRAQRVRSGLFLAVVGPPNVGKSSLVNRLAGREAAIVSEWPGTTRDPIEVRLVLGDVPVTLVDTAGLRETVDPLEAEGVRRTRRHAAQADLVLHVGAGDAPSDPPAGGLAVWNKIDLKLSPSGPPPSAPPPGWLGVSARTGEGLPELEHRLHQAVLALTDTGAGPPLTRARHRAGVAEAIAQLEAAQHLDLPELRCEALRLAMLGLGRITGTVGVEDLLESIFGAFCIGK